MKILISAYACIPYRGSEPGVGWNWTIEHALLGHEVWCFTTHEGRDQIEEEMKNHPVENLHFVFVSSPGWANWLYRFQPFVYFHYLLWQYNASKIALQLDRKINFDLVLHITLSSLQLASGFWRLKKPLIFGPVGGGSFAPAKFRKYFGSAWAMEVLRKITSDLLIRFNPDVKKVCGHAKLILVANKDTYRMAKKLTRADVRIFLDSGLSNDFFHSQCRVSSPEKKMKILWVGRIFARKGLPLVLDALSKVSKKVPFHLTILGDGKSAYKIPAWLKYYSLENEVTWRGHVSWEEVRKAYQEHDVFLLCSLRDSFGSQFMEAMAYGLPIVTLDHQGAGDHIADNCGIKVPVTNPEETARCIAAAIEFMHNFPEQRLAFGEHGRAFARSQRWADKVRIISELYDDVVKKPIPISEAV